MSSKQLSSQRLSIVHIAAEHADFVYTGGLGEVLAGLPEAQAAHGHDVTVVLPGSPHALERLTVTQHFDVPVELPWGPARVTAHVGAHRGTRVVLLSEPALFARASLYGTPEPYSDNPVRFATFARAAAKVAAQADIAHLHDWHAGLAAPHLTAFHPAPASRPRVVFTLHNLAFEGAFATAGFGLTGLPPEALGVDGLLHFDRVSPLKAGLYYADLLTTVSPTYAAELLTDAGGWAFAGLLRHRHADLVGIVNGLRGLSSERPASHPHARSERRAALAAEVGIAAPAPGGIGFAMVSRLTLQKGVDLVIEALPRTLAAGHTAIVLGSGDTALVAALRALQGHHPGRLAFVDTFDPGLADRIFAGSDVVMVPSRFEPCGLVQLHAMRAGALPLVRKTGGLADTVRDVAEGGWGFVFEGEALAGAIDRAVAFFAEPAAVAAARTRGQAIDVSWDRPARAYEDCYRALRAR